MDRKEFNMNEQIIINWTKTEMSETLIIKANFDGNEIVRVENDSEKIKNVIEQLKNILKNG